MVGALLAAGWCTGMAAVCFYLRGFIGGWICLFLAALNVVVGLAHL